MKRGHSHDHHACHRCPSARAAVALRMTPGRWVALAIGVPVALALIGWSAFSLVAGIGRASFPVSTSIPVQDGHLVASTGGGDITVHQDQTRSDTARLTGTVQYSLVRPRLTISGDGVHLDCRLLTGNCGLSATLDVPLDTAVNVTSEGGNMQVNGIQSDAHAEQRRRRRHGLRGGGTADVSTGGGNVTASDLGNIRQFSTDGGDVNGNGLFAPHVTTESGGGNVTLVFTRGAGEPEDHQRRGRHLDRAPAGQHPLRHRRQHRWWRLQRIGSGQLVRPPTRSR